MEKLKFIQINAINGAEVIILIDKITHIYSTETNKTMIKLVNNEGVLTDMSIIDIISLINESYDIK